MRMIEHSYKVVIFTLLILIIGCSKGVIGGSPAIPFSDTTGTSFVLNATEDQVGDALTNAFGMFKYHESPFLSVINNDWDYLAPNFHPKNGFILYNSNFIRSHLINS
jgi:hypothetical protein